MSTLSPVVALAVRAALASQGYPPGIIRADGTFDFSLLSASTYETVEFWTEVTAPVNVNVSELLRPGPPHPVLMALKPTIVLRGPAGERVIAPYGTARRDGAWKGAAATVGLVLGLMWLGRVTA